MIHQKYSWTAQEKKHIVKYLETKRIEQCSVCGSVLECLWWLWLLPPAESSEEIPLAVLRHKRCTFTQNRMLCDGCWACSAQCYVSLLFFFSEQTGQLNEYTERKEMSADVVCMALGKVPVGEQRCRFLAVGLSDNTVRIISLDPTVSVLWLVKCLSIFWQEKTKSICEILACCCHETWFHYGLR